MSIKLEFKKLKIYTSTYMRDYIIFGIVRNQSDKRKNAKFYLSLQNPRLSTDEVLICFYQLHHPLLSQQFNAEDLGIAARQQL